MKETDSNPNRLSSANYMYFFILFPSNDKWDFPIGGNEKENCISSHPFLSALNIPLVPSPRERARSCTPQSKQRISASIPFAIRLRSVLAFATYLLGEFRLKWTSVKLLLPRSCICHVLTLRLPHCRFALDRSWTSFSQAPAEKRDARASAPLLVKLWFEAGRSRYFISSSKWIQAVGVGMEHKLRTWGRDGWKNFWTR